MIKEKSISIKFNNLKQVLLSIRAIKIYAIIFSILLLFLMYAFAITPERYNISIGQISPKTIVASREIIDEVNTEKERSDAVRNIEPSYVSVADVSPKVLSNLDEIIKELEVVQKYGQSIINHEGISGDFFYFEQKNVNYAKSILTKITLTDNQVRTVLNLSHEEFKTLSSDLRSTVSNILTTTIREGYVSETISYLQQIMGYRTDINLLQNIVTPVLETCIKPNMIVDKEATNNAKKMAMEAVEPVVYQKGQNIVLEGNRIYKYQYEMIKSLGLLDDQEIDLPLYFSVLSYIIITVFIMIMLMFILKPRLILSQNDIIIQLLCIIITSFFSILAKYINIYLAPILMVSMILSVLLGIRSAFIGNISIALLNIILLAGNTESYGDDIINMIILCLISGSVVTYLLYKKQRRHQLLMTGLIIGFVNFVIVMIVGILTKNNVEKVIINASWSFLGGILSTLLTLTIEPIFESIFNIPTENRLLELTNPEQPLMRKMLLEAPGTYHHSIVVANLAESAADKIGANSLMARAGAYYHDIGKLKSPMSFKENQIGENMHMHVDSYESAEIITSHTKNGYLLAKQYKLPEIIRNIILTHHGDSVTMYFYHEAIENAGYKPVDISKFRYAGPKPNTKEAAIIMLADTVEAAVRSMKDHTRSAMETFIKKLIDAKIEDGQLNDSNLTLKDIDDIANSFVSVLSGAYHDRVEYPSISPMDEHIKMKNRTHIDNQIESKDKDI